MTLQNVRFRVHINFKALQDSHTNTTGSKWNKNQPTFDSMQYYIKSLHCKCNTGTPHCNKYLHVFARQCNSRHSDRPYNNHLEDNPRNLSLWIGCYTIKQEWFYGT